MKLRPSPCANFVPRAAQQPQTSSSETGMIWVWLVMVNSTPFPSLKLVLWYQNNSHLSSQLSKTQREVGKAFPFCSDCHKRRIMWWAAVAPLRSERLLKATAHIKNKRPCVCCCMQLTAVPAVYWQKESDYLLVPVDIWWYSAHNSGMVCIILAVVSMPQSLSQTCLLRDLHNCCPY